MNNNDLEDFVPESLQQMPAPSAEPKQPSQAAWQGKAARAIELFMVGFVIILAVGWLMGLIDPPPASSAMQKAYSWARDKAPIGSTISYLEHGACEETLNGVVVRLIVQVPGESGQRHVHVNLRRSWRWWVID